MTFSFRETHPPDLHVRTFRLNSREFVEKVLSGRIPASVQDVHAAVIEYFAEVGVDLSPTSGKNIFFSDGSGRLMVRATLEELDRLETHLAKLPR